LSPQRGTTQKPSTKAWPKSAGAGAKGAET
jgi:hypothetical protein